MISILKKALVSACYAFTSLTVLYALFMICVYDTSEGIYMSAVTVFMFFPLAFFISLANLIVKETKLSGGIKLFMHFATVTLSLILFIYIPHGGGISSGNAMIIFALYVILYLIGVLIFNFVRAKKKKSTEKKSEYKKVY